MQEKREGVRGSLIGSTTTGAFADRPEQMLAAPGKEAVLSTGIPWAGKRETTVGQGGGGSSTPVEAVAQMKWVEKQGNNDGMMDVEVGANVVSLFGERSLGFGLTRVAGTIERSAQTGNCCCATFLRIQCPARLHGCGVKFGDRGRHAAFSYSCSMS